MPSSWSYSLVVNTGNVKKDESVTKSLKINIPNNYDRGNYYFNVTATSNKRNSISKMAPILVKVLEIFEIDLTIDEKDIYINGTPKVDETIKIFAKIHNNGNIKGFGTIKSVNWSSMKCDNALIAFNDSN